MVRGGTGVLFSPIMLALIQNNVADPFIGAATNYNRTDLAARDLKWPNYADDIQDAVLADNAGKKAIYSLIDPDIRAPYTVQSMINVQRSFGTAWMAEAGYIRTDGRNFPLSRPLASAFDRQTGARPNPALGTPSGVYLTSEQTMVYDALQASVRRRFDDDLGLGFHYTYSRGFAEQGGSLASNFVNSDYFVTQDFFDPFYDRNPLSQEARHRIAFDAIYQLPSPDGAVLSQIFGGWQISGILSARTGVPLRVTQPSGIPNSRPDLIGDDPVLDDYRETRLYLDRSQFALVPVSSITTATLRPGDRKSRPDPRPRELVGEPVGDQGLPLEPDRSARRPDGRVQCVQPGQLQQPEHEHHVARLRASSDFHVATHGATGSTLEFLTWLCRGSCVLTAA